MQKLLTIIVFALTGFSAHAGIFSGKITDEKGQPLPFASVFIKGTSNGVTANAEGHYTLSLEPGTYTVVFQYVGYQKKEEQVIMNDNPVIKDISLQPQNISIKTVVIRADAEDPAYRIIRAAIKRRKSYLEQVNAYSCKVYIKGVNYLDSLPSRILGMKVSKAGLDSSKLGIIYLSESESEYHFKQPDEVKEVMLSSKVSGNNKAFSYNKASDFDLNFYKNLQQLGSLGDRGFVSPISETAMLYYRYKLIGTFFDDGEMVNKIEIIPKRAHDPVFNGYIYIVENSWRIHSTDVYLTKDANIDFVDSVRIKQTYNKVADTIWMPFNQTMTFTFKIFGIKGHGRFLGVFRDYDMQPGFRKHFFNGEELKVNDNANKTDSTYWDVNRPVPLTKEEANDYRKKDSLARIHNSKKYLDSMDKKRNAFDVSDVITGYNYYRRFNKTTYSISGLLSFINYNTVQGWAPHITLGFSKEFEDRRQFYASAMVAYGVSDKIVSAVGNVYYMSNPVRFTSWNVTGDRNVQQFNSDNPINPLINTIYTLIEKENYMKLYDDAFIKGRYQTELTNGIMFSGAVSYGRHSPLNNTTSYTWSHKEGDSFTPDYPYTTTTQTNFTAYKALVTDIDFTFHIKQKYDIRPHHKIITGSKYPAFNIDYKKGIDALGSSVNFDQLEARISQDLNFGLFGHSQYNIAGGDFLNNQYVGIAELKHFDGNQTIFSSSNYMNSYQLLPYYTYSTNRYYLQGHFEHHFEGFILNKIPVLRKLKWHEVVGVHYLYTQAINYTEVSVGFEDIFKVLRVDFVNSYSNAFKLRSGIVIGVNIF